MLKRLFDILFALLWLIVTAPVFLVIALLVTFTSPGGLFYAPLVVGQHGKTFRALRFRTMVVVDPINPNRKRSLTSVGRFIRNYSLDHLPALLNLLYGDLTLVGPRPMEVDVFDPNDPVWQRYIQVKPGVFNYAILKLGKEWTPSRQSHPALNQELELEYIERRSSWFDLRIFLDSLRAFARSKGNIKMRSEADPAVKGKIGLTTKETKSTK